MRAEPRAVRTCFSSGALLPPIGQPQVDPETDRLQTPAWCGAAAPRRSLSPAQACRLGPGPGPRQPSEPLSRLPGVPRLQAPWPPWSWPSSPEGVHNPPHCGPAEVDTLLPLSPPLTPRPGSRDRRATECLGVWVCFPVNGIPFEAPYPIGVSKDCSRTQMWACLATRKLQAREGLVFVL